MRPDVLLLATHWHDSESVQRFLSHVAQIAGSQRVHTVVADNSQSWPGPAPRGVTIVRPPENLGYLNGCAFGLGAWREVHSALPEWIGVTNTDVTFDGDFFDCLVQRHWPEDAAVLAPSITTLEETAQNPFMSVRPTRAWLIRTGWMLRFPVVHRLARSGLYPLWRRLRGSRLPPATESIYAPHGSVMLFHRRLFERGGTLAYGGFLFGEEIHVAEQARRAGLRVYFAPGLHVRHHEGAATSHADLPRLRRWHVASNRWLLTEYFRETGGG